MPDTLVLDLDGPDGGATNHKAGSIECDPLLVEQVLFLAILGTAQEKAYHAAREACYQEPDLERRDRAFLRLEREWFVTLDLARPAIEALAEWPTILSRVHRCILAPCMRRRDECAELYGKHTGDGPKPNLLIRLDADFFRHPAHMRAFLRHELMHISDMLDPRFEYDPSLSQFLDETGIPNAIRDRYRILWNIYIDGRLSTRHSDPIASLTRHQTEFSRLFRALGSRSADAFNWIFNARTLTHPDILTFARAPLTLLQQLDVGRP